MPTPGWTGDGREPDPTASGPDPAASDPDALHRRLGAMDGTAVVISNVVGTGIFLTPAFIAQRVPTAIPFLGLWVLGGVLSVIGALAYAELAAMRPRAGGEYVYIREAFGPLAGFLSGWTSLVAGFSGAIAAAAVGFAIYLENIVPGTGSTAALLRFAPIPGAPGITVTPRALIALGLIGLFSGVHMLGLRPGRWVQQALAWLNVGTILLLVVFGFAATIGGAAGTGAAAVGAVGQGTATAGGAGAGPDSLVAAGTGAETVAGLLDPGAALVALVLVMFTFSGWNAAAYVAGEMRSPGRTLPRALLGGTAVVTLLYLALNVLYVRVLGMGGVAAAEATGHQVAETLWGPAGTRLFTPLILLVLASSVSAMVLTGPRVYYAMARDRCLPAAFARVRDRGVPTFSIGVQAAWSAILVLTGTFEALLTYTGFAVVLFAALGVGAVFVLRHKQPDAHRPFRTWGYPVAPALFVLAAAAMVFQAIVRAPGPSMAGVVLIGLGAPVYRAVSGWARSHGS